MPLYEPACAAPDAPSPFPDDWGTGRHGRARRSRALANCRTCPIRRQCGEEALDEYEAGLDLYGIRGGVVFSDVTRPEAAIVRLRRLVAA